MNKAAGMFCFSAAYGEGVVDTCLKNKIQSYFSL